LSDSPREINVKEVRKKAITTAMFYPVGMVIDGSTKLADPFSIRNVFFLSGRESSARRMLGVFGKQ
jgi:hypothetical protein